MRHASDSSSDPLPAGFQWRRWSLVLAAFSAVSAAFIAGRGSRPSIARASEPLYYVDPMHPAYRSDRPGKAPDCGMDLEPVYASVTSAASSSISPNNIRLSPDQEHSIRLETEVVRAESGSRSVHTAGRVVPDESRVYRVSAGADGWVRHVFSDRTGTHVRRGQALAAFFTNELSAPQQAFVYAMESYERVKQNPSPAAGPLALATQQLATARDNLQFLGMGDAQIEQLGRTRKELLDIHLTAPADGQILERHVAVGQRFMKGEPLYRIANLERVWVLADVQTGDGALLSSIAKARIRLEGGTVLNAQAAGAPLEFDAQGRTGKLRLNVDNPRGTLFPGMIVNVDLYTPVVSSITAPADALIDSGTAAHVFVALGSGEYEAREVKTGWQEGNRVEIREGLTPGDRVVTAGAFLLDSESRMKSASDEVIDPECGMKIERTNARRKDWKGATQYFCSEACERKFLSKRLR